MGFFDIFKSPEEKLQEKLYKAIFEESFPNGLTQLEDEARGLCKLLDYKYSIDEVRRAYVTLTQTYFLTKNKTEGNLILSILLAENNRIQKPDAITIYVFLSRKLANYAKAKSLLILASKVGCDPPNVKETYLETLKDKGLNTVELQELINVHQEQSELNAVSLNMAAENTPAGLLETWTKEYLETLEEEPFIDPVKEFLFKEVFKGEPQTFDSMLRHIAYENEKAEYYRLEAIDKIYDDKDYETALELIDKGLAIKDKETEPYLFNLRAECNILIGNYPSALVDINNSLKSFNNNLPEDEDGINDSIKIKDKIEALLKNNNENTSLSSGFSNQVLARKEFFALHNIVSVDSVIFEDANGYLYVSMYTDNGKCHNIYFDASENTKSILNEMDLEKGSDITPAFFQQFRFMWKKSSFSLNKYDWEIIPIQSAWVRLSAVLADVE